MIWLAVALIVVAFWFTVDSVLIPEERLPALVCALMLAGFAAGAVVLA